MDKTHFKRCDGCPIARPRDCPSVVLEHRPFCDRIAAGVAGAAGHLRALADFQEGGGDWAEPQTPDLPEPSMRRVARAHPYPGRLPSDPPDPDWPGPGLPGPPARAPAAAGDAGLAILAEFCPHGAGPCGCGEAPRLCGHPDRPAEVWRPACLRCVARSGWESGVEATG